MGEFIFTYPKEALSASAARQAFMTGKGRLPVATDVKSAPFDEKRNLLVLTTASDNESGCVYVPAMNLKDRFFFASSDPLPPGQTVRPLFLELSRGQLSRILRKRFDWACQGMTYAEPLLLAIRRAVQRFSVIVTSDRDADGFDQATIALFEELCEITRVLNERFIEQTLTARRNLPRQWSTKFGFSAPVNSNWTTSWDSMFAARGMIGRRKPRLDPVFKTFNPRFTWDGVETSPGVCDFSNFQDSLRLAEKRRLNATVGPLIRWGTDIPARFYGRPTSQDEFFDDFQKYVVSAVDAATPNVKRWIVATNVESSMSGFPFEFRFQLAAQAVYWIKERRPDSQVFLGFEQAFGDAAKTGRPYVMTSFDLAARLYRRRLFDGFYLETNFGLAPGQTSPRDPMEFHRFFDRWAWFGAPLSIATSCPSASPADGAHIASRTQEQNACDPLIDAASGRPFEELCWSETIQQECARTLISSALARRVVDEIIWTRFEDESPLDYDAYFNVMENARFEAKRAVAGQARPVVEEQEEAEAVDEIYAAEDEEDYDEILEIEDSSASASSSASVDLDLIEDSLEVGKKYSADPTSGLFTADGRPKPTLHKIAALRGAYLK